MYFTNLKFGLKKIYQKILNKLSPINVKKFFIVLVYLLNWYISVPSELRAEMKNVILKYIRIDYYSAYQHLGKLLEKYLQFSTKSKDGFNKVIEMAKAQTLITEKESQSIHKLRLKRNDIAHELDVKVDFVTFWKTFYSIRGIFSQDIILTRTKSKKTSLSEKRKSVSVNNIEDAT